ncbi:hypothetical protein [Paraburkholderia sp. BCC1884]|uniref:hypothetical protein n=1 Tax=Paraburkholderia sp. BCC1884 TaxID=2562668 RepID=UPI0021B171F5|nr:hypothetical protein [Paraburkholderia sp. BCC1884]
MSHRLAGSQSTGPVWGLLFGFFMTAVGAGLWWHASSSTAPTGLDESSATAAMLIGVFLGIYSGRELFHQRR